MAVTFQVVAPCIHGNGTSAKELKDNLELAYASIYVAQDILRNCAPNGRDYYTGDVTLERAERQHQERQGALLHVMKSIETEMQLIDQGKQLQDR